MKEPVDHFNQEKALSWGLLCDCKALSNLREGSFEALISTEYTTGNGAEEQVTAAALIMQRNIKVSSTLNLYALAV